MTLEERFNGFFDSLVDRFGLPAVVEGWELHKTQRFDQIDDDELVEGLDRLEELYESLLDQVQATQADPAFDRRVRRLISGALPAELERLQSSQLTVAIEGALVFVAADGNVLQVWEAPEVRR